MRCQDILVWLCEYSFHIFSLLYTNSGTRWIPHKHYTLEVVMDKYGIYVYATPCNLAKDKSYLQKDRNKFKHWYQKWTCRIPIFVRDMVKNMRPFLAELWTLGQGGDKLLSLV